MAFGGSNFTDKWFDFHYKLTKEEYNPFEHRHPAKPTNDWETLAHLLKGCLGSGILAIPLAVRYAGLWFGFFCTFITGFVLTYCVYLVVRNSQRLCVRLQVPMLTMDEIGEAALLNGPPQFRIFSKAIKYSINAFLIVDLLGCCTVYSVFTAKNLKQVVDQYSDSNMCVRTYILILLPFFLMYILIRRLKYLAPLSVIANMFILVGMGITFYYMFSDLPNIGIRPAFGDIRDYPLYFGIAIFSLEGIGVVMPLENNMEKPEHFIGGPCVLFIGFGTVCTMYAMIGFVGYWKYGEDLYGSITLNVPQNEKLGQSVKILFALSMFQTFGLQFYVPFAIIWRGHEEKYGKWNIWVEYAVRWAVIIPTIMFGYAIPDIGSIMGLVGAICLSFVGIIFPAVIDYAVCYEDPGLGPYKWRLIVDISLFIFGILGFFFGTVASVNDIIHDFVNY